MKEISLTQNQITTVDDEDFERLYRGGFHATAKEAALAYDQLVKKYCPDFGILNFGTSLKG